MYVVTLLIKTEYKIQTESMIYIDAKLEEIKTILFTYVLHLSAQTSIKLMHIYSCCSRTVFANLTFTLELSTTGTL